MFIKVTEINSWYVYAVWWKVLFVHQTESPLRRSHATYYFIAAGCHVSLKNNEKAQKLFDAVPDLLEKKKIGGKDLPTEVWIKKKRKSP